MQIAVSDMERIDILTEEKIEELLYNASVTERSLTVGYGEINDWDEAQYHCEQSLLHTKKRKEG